ncbi:MAG: hypothetical protein KBC83_02835 [Candidatus Moranbacteria bacterium]|nr:hypothetical protein [Candidatus Moranbacteria bacterium]MBP9801574.1 hypothetical protein [Candidatus Moranbacteria bacterium]
MNEEQTVPLEPSGVSIIDMGATPAAVVASPTAPSLEVGAEPIAALVSVPEEEVRITPPQVVEPVLVVASSGGVSIGDIWSNKESSFRVDSITSVGGVSIRFRTKDMLEGSSSSFIRKARALFGKKENPPHGEWFFGSGEEMRQFIEQNAYQLEKRKEENENKDQKTIV